MDTNVLIRFCRRLRRAEGNPHAIGETYHITTDECLTWDQITHAVASAWGHEAKIVHVASDALFKSRPELTGPLLYDSAHCNLFDNTKIKNTAPDFMAKIRFDQGVRIAVDYIEATPHIQKLDTEFDQWSDKMIERYG